MSTIKNREQSPKVFALLHEIVGSSTADGRQAAHALYITPHYSLEEADKEARASIIQKYQLQDQQLKLSMYVSHDLEKMLRKVSSPETLVTYDDPKEQFKHSKNQLMKVILDKKDNKLLKEVEPMLGEADVKYLRKALSTKDA